MLDHGLAGGLESLSQGPRLDEHLVASLIAAGGQSIGAGLKILQQSGDRIGIVGLQGDRDVDGGDIFVDSHGCVASIWGLLRVYFSLLCLQGTTLLITITPITIKAQKGGRGAVGIEIRSAPSMRLYAQRVLSSLNEACGTRMPQERSRDVDTTTSIGI